MYLHATNRVTTPNLKYADSSTNYCVIMMLQNLKKVLKLKIFNFFLIPEARSVVCAIHVVKRPSKRSVLVYLYTLHPSILLISKKPLYYFLENVS